MRLGVLDVGSNTVHLLVVDAHQGARPLPAFSHKEELHLADHLDAQNRLTAECADRLLVFVRGSLEIASGQDEDPSVAVSLPLGANRLTREWLTRDPPDKEEVRRLRKHVRVEIAAAASAVRSAGTPDHRVASSKTFRQLARIAGAAASSEGPYVKRVLKHADVRELADRLPKMTVGARAQLPGVSRLRAPQLAAGAIVADAAMDLFHLPELEICPWALREGVILRRMDSLGEASWGS